MFQPVNLHKWIEDNEHLLQPPVSNKQVWIDDRESIVMIVGGPNARNDYHVNCTEEFFYQVQGDITVRIMHPDTGRPHDVVIREGDVYLLPADVPHCPIRPAGTIGLVLEQPRPAGALDDLRWHCGSCHALVHEAPFTLQDIAVDLKRIMERFWADASLRTCPECGEVVEHPGEAQAPAQAG